MLGLSMDFEVDRENSNTRGGRLHGESSGCSAEPSGQEAQRCQEPRSSSFQFNGHLLFFAPRQVSHRRMDYHKWKASITPTGTTAGSGSVIRCSSQRHPTIQMHHPSLEHCRSPRPPVVEASPAQIFRYDRTTKPGHRLGLCCSWQVHQMDHLNPLESDGPAFDRQRITVRWQVVLMASDCCFFEC
jgi:hypothetical protein